MSLSLCVLLLTCVTPLGCGQAPVIFFPAGDTGGSTLRADPSRSTTLVSAQNDGSVAVPSADVAMPTEATVILDGTASTACADQAASAAFADGDPIGECPRTVVRYDWFLGAELIAEGARAEINLPPGIFSITLIVTDSRGGTDSAGLSVTVVDNEAQRFSVVIGVSGQGETIPSAGVSRIAAGETIRVQAIAASGFRFLRWSGDIASEVSSTLVLVDRDLFITAEFVAVDTMPTPRFFLPWAEGQARVIGQGNDGEFSHQDLFAWDIPMPTGMPILATAAGRVIDVRENASRDDPFVIDLGDPANFIAIDHGRGLQSLYAHLDFLSVCVVPGQLVSRGQVLGLSGNTGFSTAPHLHYEVLDVQDASTPSGFFESDRPDGVAEEGDMLTSLNRLNTETEAGFVASTLPLDAFLSNDVELTGNPPPAYFYYTDTDYVFEGRVRNGATRICVAFVEPESFETVFCEISDVADDGSFVKSVRLPGDLRGKHFLGIITGDDNVEGLATRSVWVLPSPAPTDRPVAVIDAPEDPAVDFGQTRRLVGMNSFSPLDRGVNYHWMQASGPPALIRNPTAPQTEFTIQPGAGIERVSFQLVVDDGEQYSAAAQVDFLMPDLFHVNRIGVSDTVCIEIDDCPIFSAPPPIVRFATQVVQGWVELINVEPGDQLTFSLTNPRGEFVRSTTETVGTQPPVTSFRRFVWSTIGFELIPGDWAGTFTRNGVVEATVEFRVVP